MYEDFKKKKTMGILKHVFSVKRMDEGIWPPLLVQRGDSGTALQPRHCKEVLQGHV
jgi:hypothetical protein